MSLLCLNERGDGLHQVHRLRLHLELDLNLDLEHRTASISDSFIVRLFLLILRIALFPWQVTWKPPICCQINP
jgi:hypothetical protein